MVGVLKTKDERAVASPRERANRIILKASRKYY